ncbi:MAG: hypothetical protein KJZ65_13775 [Phycisphaerales bacterium]|nr:hypothetical protein [Phycisphaerales bacterium]
MIAFTIYAFLVGYLALRWRRRLLGYLLVSVCVGLLVALAWAHAQIPRLAEQGWRLARNIDILPFQAVLYPYIVCTAGIGYFMVSLPRRRPLDSCWHCRYDLSAHLGEPGVIVCPECGREHCTADSPRYRRSGEDRAQLSSSDIAIPAEPGPTLIRTVLPSPAPPSAFPAASDP